MSKKIQFIGFVVMAGVLVVGESAYAYDAVITCDNSECTYSPSGEPLWDENNVMAGETVSKTLFVNNERTDDCDFSIEIKNEGGADVGFLENMFVAISMPDEVVYGGMDEGDANSAKNFNEMINSGQVALGTIGSGEEVEYSWLLTLNKDIDNRFQGVESIFDFNLNFTCLEEDAELLEILESGGAVLPATSGEIVLEEGTVAPESSGSRILGAVSNNGDGDVLPVSASCSVTCGGTWKDFAKLIIVLLIILLIVRYIYLIVDKKRN